MKIKINKRQDGFFFQVRIKNIGVTYASNLVDVGVAIDELLKLHNLNIK